MNLLGANLKMGNHRSVPAKFAGCLALILALFLVGGWADTGGVRPVQAGGQEPRVSRSCTNVDEYVEPTYGSRIRRLKNPDGYSHNIYYYRRPWSANNTYLISVWTDRQQNNWRVVLHDGQGCYLKELFRVDQFDWRLVWDRKDPEVLYTWKGTNLYRYNVTTGKADLLKSFASLNLSLKPNGPSVNQAGDRILVTTSDGMYRSYRLPDMQEEHTFTVTYPPNCATSWSHEHFIGYRNYISTPCASRDLSTQAILIHDDTGTLVHRLDGVGGGGHFDFSSDGRLAYFKMWSRGSPLEIRIVNLNGSDDRVLYSVPQTQASYVQNLHLSWPDKVGSWFLASFFPSVHHLPSAYAPPLDEILLVNTNGSHRFLARTGTAIAARREGFWGQPLASPSSDGSRVSFNSNRGGSIHQYILWVPPDALQGMTR